MTLNQILVPLIFIASIAVILGAYFSFRYKKLRYILLVLMVLFIAYFYISWSLQQAFKGQSVGF
ncbi:hypothetical protein A2W48_00725 [Candidatus Giovannonibacteria bacterium RIFCSPHIGHO2_12_44_12]|uniref:Uncharacterized protein n=2 Tax=Candidatus Giovannoniibacteriota TaxID=1752738 RepID=A0A1F5X1T8_9BACT|nr:MAG: hypothetical protein A2W48_00725 [Candidatus Giovannonibacteria bacterium RIFCSPHIGHO2_12_44_12]OGF85629.1 MAG: hypothetical protein A2Z63_01515 [Candidatus Giovannonibacteria bacterium RIFCSPLOWO2_02_44_8]